MAVYVRSPAPAATEQQQQTVLARLRSLSEAGQVDDFTVTYWFRQAIERDGEPTLSSIAELEAWATDRGLSLAPALDRHERHNWYTGVDDAVVTLPVICLAIYEDDELRGVYPHVCPEGPRSVADGLDRLEAGSLAGA